MILFDWLRVIVVCKNVHSKIEEIHNLLRLDDHNLYMQALIILCVLITEVCFGGLGCISNGLV